MQIDLVDQFQIELFKQVNVNQAKKPPENQNGNISIYA
jgi:hypothetical protein